MKELYGVTVAMVTPITRDNQVDPQGIAQLTNMLIEKGVNCLYPCGTTGEMLRLSLAERPGGHPARPAAVRGLEYRICF